METTRTILAVRRFGILAEVRNGPCLATTLPLHLHEELQVILSETRLITYGIKGANLSSPLASVFLVEPEVPHTAQVQAKQLPIWGSLRTFLIPRSSFASYLGEEALRQDVSFASPISADPMLLKTLSNMHGMVTQGLDDLLSESALVASLERIFSKIRQAPSEPRTSVSQRKMRRVRALLGSDFHRSISLSEIAVAIELSPHHALRQFKQVFGVTPHAFRTQLRLARARDLLLTNVPITEVALMTGFSDHAHLTRAFHKYVGVPPSRYRSSNILQDEKNGPTHNPHKGD